MRDVVVDELWKRTVANTPINSAITGSLVAVKMESAISAPMCLMADDMPLIPTRNIKSALRTPAVLSKIRNVSFFIYDPMEPKLLKKKLKKIYGNFSV
jgi:hypothetical protein